jgi:hypothetical protein
LAETPLPPPPLHIRGRYWSAKLQYMTSLCDPCAGILGQSMEARSRAGIGLS